jgi:hypothetical protein
MAHAVGGAILEMVTGVSGPRIIIQHLPAFSTSGVPEWPD